MRLAKPDCSLRSIAVSPSFMAKTGPLALVKVSSIRPVPSLGAVYPFRGGSTKPIRGSGMLSSPDSWSLARSPQERR